MTPFQHSMRRYIDSRAPCAEPLDNRTIALALVLVPAALGLVWAVCTMTFGAPA